MLERGEHVALVGPNGSGKTTLLETLLGERQPDAGSCKLGHGVVPAYFSPARRRAAEDAAPCSTRAVAATGLPRPQAQSLLGRFLFSGWETHEKQVVGALGRRAAAALARALVASGANLLVLDEPTNHLDLESREALEAALEAFPGTILLVSHDRALLDAVPDRIVAVEDLGAALLRRRLGRSRARAPRRSRAAAARRAAEAARSRASPRRRTQARRSSSWSRRRSRSSSASVAELEGKLAEDWTNMDMLAAHRAARDELQQPARRAGRSCSRRARCEAADASRRPRDAPPAHRVAGASTRSDAPAVTRDGAGGVERACRR